MHENRNFLLVLAVAAAVAWSGIAWLLLDPESGPIVWLQRIAALVVLAVASGWLVYALLIEDKLPNYMKNAVGEMYFEADGLAFMPTIRLSGGRPELSLYYQNRFEGPVSAVVHLRPPEESFQINDGWRDVHFAFTAGGGDFGVIHQPIIVPDRLRGEVVDVQLAAATYYPRGHGSRLRKGTGLDCGTLLVDWQGAAFRSGVHEVSGEIELVNPCTVHLAMPFNIQADEQVCNDTWRQEQIHAGTSATG